MGSAVRRIFTQKRAEFDSEASAILAECRDNLGIAGVTGVRVLHRYDIEGLSELAYAQARGTIFSEPPVDLVFDEEFSMEADEKAFAWEYLPGQYDQRADSAAQAVQILTHGERPKVKCATVVVLKGDRISFDQFDQIKEYIINPVDSREASFDKPESLSDHPPVPGDVKVVEGFIGFNDAGLGDFLSGMGFAMDLDDLKFCQAYFREEEKRDPTLTELKIIDTYWSDHCRHTTFLTRVESVDFGIGPMSEPVRKAYDTYLKCREDVYSGRTPKPQTLMDIATIGMKEIKRRGFLNDLDESDEINACSVRVAVDVDGTPEDWLIQFKNETHNHPTEIEPFGGAATCIGGAIRDPLSGRAYVYQAMRVTGSGDPRIPLKDTLPGKLPQRKITLGAAHGYSSYGNQIGLATGLVSEIYHPGYVAKRMEIGAVIGAVKADSVVRKSPEPGDVVILLGGRTGRDGCGGATGSSKSHTESSIETSGAEVQKGNAPEERKIQRLFRQPNVTRLIKKCNDFGAGGVSVAIGELADGLEIDLDNVPKKYEGLDGTELAISESQERMAVVVAATDELAFIHAALTENLEATPVAVVTKEPAMVMRWRGKQIVHLKRDFLNSNGAEKDTRVRVENPEPIELLTEDASLKGLSWRDAWLSNVSRLECASQKGLSERFDSTIGAGTVLMPYGGKTQLSPSDGMAAKVPLLKGETSTATYMAWGYDSRIAEKSPFHGALYAVVESVARLAAMGADIRKARLSLQEYFEKPNKDPKRWGKPFSALLGAMTAQLGLSIPAIGGKDSMSGSFKELDVPPTLVSFSVAAGDVRSTVSSEFKSPGNSLIYLPVRRDDHEIPDFDYLKRLYTAVYEAARKGQIHSARALRGYGLSEAVTKMALGNWIGVSLNSNIEREEWFGADYGSLLIEVSEWPLSLLKEFDSKQVGATLKEDEIRLGLEQISLDELKSAWTKPLDEIFPAEVKEKAPMVKDFLYPEKSKLTCRFKTQKPRVFISVFPGTNCEYDTARAFERAGAETDIFVFRNQTPSDLEYSLEEMAKRIGQAQMVMLPGGFSAGDEPEGSGKFIASVYRNPKVRDATMELLKNRDGLILGICNGFQALIKLGLVPYGEIRDMDADSPTLTYNSIGRHVSQMVRTKVVSKLSPWLANVSLGDVHTIPVSHGEGRFIASPEWMARLIQSGQIATQYVDAESHPADSMPDNPNGSFGAVEGITSPDGRVFGKMGHSERFGEYVAINIPGEKDQKIFRSGVEYFL